MSDEVCTNCRGWRRAEDERFCGLCGASFVHLEATVTVAFTYSDGERLSPPSEFNVELTNAGGLNATGTKVRLELDPSHFREEREITESSPGVLHIDPFELPSSLLSDGRPRTGRLLQIMPGNQPHRTLAEMGFGLPRPRMELDPKEFILDESQINLGKARFDVVMTEGVLAPIRRIHVVRTGDENDDGSESDMQVEPNRTLPTVLRQGDVVHAEIRFPPRAFGTELRASETVVERTLRIEFVDLQSIFSYKLRFRSDTPPRPVFRMPRNISAMMDRPLRLPVVLHNSGSRACTLGETLLMDTMGGGESRILEFKGKVGASIEGGGERRFTITLAVGSESARILRSEGERRLRLEQRFLDSGVEPATHDMLLAVRAPRPLSSIVSIDFGTTESAVSIFDNAPGKAPKLIELGEEGPFVPTVIAYYTDSDSGELNWEIGHAAQRHAESGDGNSYRFFDNLKWQISDHELYKLPHGGEVTMVRVVADYLSRLKDRIESHPEVAGEVTRVYITRPARFGSTKTNFLEEAFRRAGMEPQLVPSKDKKPIVLSESLSPSMLVLHRPHLAEIKKLAMPGEILEDPFGKTHWLLTIDIGGGSADFSLFRIDYVDHREMSIDEVEFDGDHRICGNKISAWLYDAIRDSLRVFVSNHGINPDDVPVHFPWEPIPTSGVEPIQRRNGMAIAKLLFQLQRQDGPFLDLEMNLQQSLGARSPAKEGDRILQEDPESTGMVTLQDLIFALDGTGGKAKRLQEEWDRLPFEPDPLSLRTRDGRDMEIPWAREGGLDLDLRAAMPAFMRSLYRPLETHLRRLVEVYKSETEDGRNAPPLNVLVTGRGGLFPFADSMILHQIRRLAGDNPTSIKRVEVALSKSITSLGACLIADIAAKTIGVRFHALGASWVAVVGGPTRASSERLEVHRLYEGELLPEDGLCSVARPMWVGRFLCQIRLVQVTGEETDVPYDRELLTNQIQKEVVLPEAPDLRTYVVVRAVKASVLEIGIGLCHVDKKPTRQEDSFDDIQWLDRRSLLPFEPT